MRIKYLSSRFRTQAGSPSGSGSASAQSFAAGFSTVAATTATGTAIAIATATGGGGGASGTITSKTIPGPTPSGTATCTPLRCGTQYVGLGSQDPNLAPPPPGHGKGATQVARAGALQRAPAVGGGDGEERAGGRAVGAGDLHAGAARRRRRAAPPHPAARPGREGHGSVAPGVGEEHLPGL